ncbi:S8 family serine peptidase [Chloroflexia bacterium SDU3-3]|nr:S8 family serine peptidase [Chloroflexia bacterium SDU3-3]
MSSHTLFLSCAIALSIVPIAPLQGQPQPSAGTGGALNAAAAVDHVLVRTSGGAPQVAGATHLFGSWYSVPLVAGISAGARAQEIGALPNVELTQPDYTIQISDMASASLQSDVNDPYYGYQWHLRATNAPAVWPTTTGAGAVVAVLDTGIASAAPDMGCHSFVSPYSAITGEASLAAAQDDNGHGTHVAGTVAECSGNGQGGAGMAGSATLMPVKVCNAFGGCSMSDIAEGIIWASSHGAGVINLSLGTNCAGVGSGLWPDCSAGIVNDAIAMATAADVLIVAAAGNASQSVVSFPANHPDVLAVAALDALDAPAPYTNTGSAIGIAAPGGNMGADATGDGYGDGVLQQTLGSACGSASAFAYCFMQGTSMASPHVAGAAALLRAAAPSASRAQVRQALEQGAQDLGAAGFDATYGYGALRVDTALARLYQLTSATPTPTATAPASTPTATAPASTPTPTATAPASTPTPTATAPASTPTPTATAPASTPTATAPASTPTPTATPGLPVPSITALLPDALQVGDAPRVITVAGEGFGAGSAVLWDGEPRDTAYVGDDRLTFTTAAGDTAAVGWHSVQVTAAGGISVAWLVPVNAQPVDVAAPAIPGEEVRASVETPDGPVTVAFGGLVGAGSLQVAAHHGAAAATAGVIKGLPSYFELAEQQLSFHTAQVCFPYQDADLAAAGLAEGDLRLWHFAEGAWHDITVSHDLAANRICGTTASFSPFVLGTAVDSHIYLPLLQR